MNSIDSQPSGLNDSDGFWLPQIDAKSCTGCGDCVVACPTQALAMLDQVAFVATPRACDYCGICEAICPVDAITLPYQIIQ